MGGLEPLDGGGVTSVALRAGLTLLESSILGAITVVGIAIAAWAVWKLSRVQDARVGDLERCNERMEALAERMASTLREASMSIEKLAGVEEDGQLLLQAMKHSLDTVVHEAIRRLGAQPGAASAAKNVRRDG